ncbi:family 2 glycosyl transferase [Planococcus antarcticus DSM 14505]|uniref:Family 2 glycosyl transferase n=1 Tax=Planococcus antarcticus DSM 14505 TaxID=1185653 RepID=A0A1C7DI06_9BACL|nr:glycosyltransferase [Planococcus antarcticus]ANU11032.1 glycosyl transferase family 2 [Planococcus antarcticus DSM 14505]EIM07036.1 family 2 glycosyl transferase [Planococcus antarcticus DSM 14505]
MGRDILVSVDCLAYNHEHYIAETIDGFLMQKTNFKFEILIHDDASVDNTTNIIKDYEKKFPDIIKPIYQKENQFSQGATMLQVNQRRAKGKYMAICEGDDYWTDPYKLQKQVDYLEANPECVLSVHSAFKFSEIRKKMIDRVRPSRQDRIFSTEEVIEGGGELFPTNSMVYRREMADHVPAFYFDAGVGDYPLTIHLAHNGRVHYMDKAMSVYRVDVKGAWSEETLSNASKEVQRHEEVTNLLDAIDSHTNFQYNKTIVVTKKKNRFYLLMRQRRFKEAFSKEYAEFYLHKEFLKRSIKKLAKTKTYINGIAISFTRKSKRMPF